VKPTLRHFAETLPLSAHHGHVCLPANAVLSNLSGGQDYTRGFAPVWTTATAALLGAVAVLLAIGWPRAAGRAALGGALFLLGACVLPIVRGRENLPVGGQRSPRSRP
jgi:hypothetical protein